MEGLLEPLFNTTPCYVNVAVRVRQAARGLAEGHHSLPRDSRPGSQLRLRPVRRETDPGRSAQGSIWVAGEMRGQCGRTHQSQGLDRVPRGVPVRGVPVAGLLSGLQPLQGDPPRVGESLLGEKPLLTTLQAPALENNRIVEADRDGRAGAQRTIVGCGRIFDTTKVAIVRPEDLTLCDRDEVGEIWVSDHRQRAEGYWQPAETNRPSATTPTDTGEGPFLRTGDLGFIKDDELVITGRHKDVIIIRGANHYPQDIEWTVQSAHPGLRPDGGAAFSVFLDDEEKLAIAQEVERDHVPDLDTRAMVQLIRQAVSEAHELDVFAVILLKRGSIPKTASSKTQRHACRNFYLHGGPEVLSGWVAPTRKRDLVPDVAHDRETWRLDRAGRGHSAVAQWQS